ncbi:hypothetical protein VNO77_27042 [Canavalia gladiata]|uniref:Bet v I/Major latex protein domain-containing protein n=1 Tax=Canavalia gladiata TaxID=3824 RepID=A0AAN9KTB3_CANGL
MAYSQLQKLESRVHIKASAEKFHDLFSNRTHHIAKICPDKVQAINIHKGEWGSEGSIISWNYLHEGKAHADKLVVESIDRENNIIIFKAVEGGLLGYYKSLKSTLQITSKENGSEVLWVLEYEKQNANIPDPHSYLKLADELSKEIDAYLTKDQN